MTAISAAQARSAVTVRTMPPWLWVWLAGYLLADMPQQISLEHSVIVTYFGHDSALRETVGNGFVTVEQLSLIFGLLIYAVIVAGAVAAMFPHLRGRWVEWRFKLASDDRPIMAEMQRFVSLHDPSISLRFTIRSDQMARIYPVGWRRARIAVFRPLPALWRRDREAAQAVLLHEVAHRRHGDQLIVGLGSPFVMLMRIWAPAYLLLVLIPVTTYLTVGRNGMAPFLAVQSIEQVVLIPAAIFLPVTALWLAELGADQMAAQAIGSGAVQQALRATAASGTSLLALLSHPPRRLRLRLATARPVGAAGLVAIWPAALLAWLLVLPIALAVPALRLYGVPTGLMATEIKVATHTLLADGRPAAIATTIALLTWPVLAACWERLWSSAPRLNRHQPWWPYLAAASLPIGMLLVSLAPLESGLPTASTTTQQPTGICAQFTSWESGEGPTGEEHIADQLPPGITSITTAAARQLDGEIRAALDNPPPGTARSIYTEAITSYGTALTDLQASNSAAANNAITNAIDLALRADTQLTQLDSQCIP